MKAKKEIFSLQSFTVVFVTLLFAGSASAIGIAPSAVTFDFEPNLHRTITYQVTV